MRCEPPNDFSVGDMPAVPSEQVIHPLHGSNGDMKSVFNGLLRESNVC